MNRKNLWKKKAFAMMLSAVMVCALAEPAAVVKADSSVDMSHFDTSSVRQMGNMFSGCSGRKACGSFFHHTPTGN